MFDLSAARPITLLSGGGTIDTQSFTTAISQGITGSGSLTKTGTGTLVLTANNSYMGPTTVSADALYVDGDQTATTGATMVVGGLTRESTKTESFATNAYKNPDDDLSLDTVKANIHTGLYVIATPEAKT